MLLAFPIVAVVASAVPWAIGVPLMVSWIALTGLDRFVRCPRCNAYFNQRGVFLWNPWAQTCSRCGFTLHEV